MIRRIPLLGRSFKMPKIFPITSILRSPETRICIILKGRQSRPPGLARQNRRRASSKSRLCRRRRRHQRGRRDPRTPEIRSRRKSDERSEEREIRRRSPGAWDPDSSLSEWFRHLRGFSPKAIFALGVPGGAASGPLGLSIFFPLKARRYTSLVSITPSLPANLSFCDKNLHNII